MKLKLIFLLFILLFFITPVTAAGGFEDDLFGWDPSSDWHDTASAMAQGFVNVFTTDSYAGDNSVQITAYAKSNQYYTTPLEFATSVDLTNVDSISYYQKHTTSKTVADTKILV